MIKLGQEIRDKVTGFKGTAIAEVEYLFGCNQFAVSPKMNENGDIKDAEFFDAGRLEILSEGVYTEEGIPTWETDVKLGNEATDIVTGFSGVITGRVRYFFGTIRYGITAKVSDNGEIKNSEYFEAKRVKVIGKGIVPEEVQVEKKGGISRDMPRGIR